MHIIQTNNQPVEAPVYTTHVCQESESIFDILDTPAEFYAETDDVWFSRINIIRWDCLMPRTSLTQSD